jgi:hypothetical protein
MAMTSMKNMGEGVCCSDGGASDDYPYNLRISLTQDQMEALKLEMPTIGDTLNLTATVQVSECSDREYAACTMQITDMEVAKGKRKGGMFPSMEVDE